MNLSRREFLGSSAAFAVVGCVGVPKGEPVVRFGFITDCHYAEHIVPKDARNYPASLGKLRAFVREMNELKVDFVVEGGDFKDLGRTPSESLGYLDEMEAAFAEFKGPRYHVLGNHDHDNLTKREFLAHIANAGQKEAKAFYSFTTGGVRFIVLDACYSPNGEPYERGNFSWKKCLVPGDQVLFLERELAASKEPCVVFVHQQLDAEDETAVFNAQNVRQVLEKSGKVRAVIQGHLHQGSFREVNGIGYCTQRASVIGQAPETNAYSVVEVYASGAVRVLGRRGATSVSSVPGPRWEGSTEWRNGHYQIHYIYSGRGESMLHIFPDGTTMLLDCGDSMRFYGTPSAVPIPDLSCRAGEFVARYVRRVSPKEDMVDILHLSHYHEDHGGGNRYHGGILPDGRPLCGISDAARFLTFGRVIDRAWPGFDDPVDVFKLANRDGTPAHMKMLYRHLAETQGTKIEKFALGSRNQFRCEGFGVPGFEVFNLCANGRYVRKDGTIRDLYVQRSAEVRAGTRKSINENGMSCGMIVKYGRFRLFTAGDFSDRMASGKNVTQIEDDLAEAVGAVEVAKLNHHGHHSMFPELVKALKARVWTNCTLDQQHCTDDSMMRLADRTLYPDGRLLVPTYQPHDRKKTDHGLDYLKDVPKCVYDSACHVIVDVPPGGESYTVSCLDALKPGNPLKAEFGFWSRKGTETVG